MTDALGSPIYRDGDHTIDLLAPLSTTSVSQMYRYVPYSLDCVLEDPWPDQVNYRVHLHSPARVSRTRYLYQAPFGRMDPNCYPEFCVPHSQRNGLTGELVYIKRFKRWPTQRTIAHQNLIGNAASLLFSIENLLNRAIPRSYAAEAIACSIPLRSPHCNPTVFESSFQPLLREQKLQYQFSPGIFI